VALREGRAIDGRTLLGDVHALALRMPEAVHVLNLCKDRYWFAVGLLASTARGVPTHLPSSSAPEGLAALCRELPGVLCLGDESAAPIPGVPYRNLADGVATPADRELEMPQIPFACHFATLYTSGSTGRPMAHRKTYGRFVQDVSSAAAFLWHWAGSPCSVVGTVPAQHMFGLESTVLLPLQCGGILNAWVPFFPAEIAQALATTPAPRLLVSTPFHLRKLLESGIALAPLAAILSSTASMPQTLAQEAERRLGAPLLEIYGSTETGQVAHRRSAVESDWRLSAGIELQRASATTIARGGHLEKDYVLNDEIELLPQSRFRLLGRNAELVNVAGKRNSLSFLNQILAAVPGVQDGVYCIAPGEAEGDIKRLVAFVVAPGSNVRQILAGLRPHMDPVFLPRPVIFVDALPRNATGKIPASALAELLNRHLP